MACAPSEGSDQLGHLLSLIRVSLCGQWVAKAPSFLHADSEDSDQTGQMPRLICVMSFCWFCHAIAHFITLAVSTEGLWIVLNVIVCRQHKSEAFT